MAAINDRLCALCGASHPTFICFCTETLLCPKCISMHILATPTLDHRPIPVAAINVPHGGATSGASTRTVSSFAQRSQDLKQALAQELLRLQEFVSNALFQLQCSRKAWQDQIARIVDSHARNIIEKAEEIGEEIRHCISEMENFEAKPSMATPIYKRLEQLHSAEAFLTLSFSVHDLDLIPLFKQAVSYVISYHAGEVQPTVLMKFFGGSNVVGGFDLQTETSCRPIATNTKFLHNSCWTVIDSGDVLITGGSQTGRSREDVLLFCPSTNLISVQEPMLVARRSHAALWMSPLCFVFGGILEEQPLSRCEVCRVKDKKWTALANMKERRAYLGCCAYKQMIVVCGGGETSSLEILDTSTFLFQFVSVPNIDLHDSVSLLAVGDCVLIFHGNFQGRASKFNPLSGSLEPQRAVCYGNSWSNTQPLVFRNAVYLLRADSVFRYDLATGESAYLMRMTKTLKGLGDE